MRAGFKGLKLPHYSILKAMREASAVRCRTCQHGLHKSKDAAYGYRCKFCGRDYNPEDVTQIIELGKPKDDTSKQAETGEGGSPADPSSRS